MRIPFKGFASAAAAALLISSTGASAAGAPTAPASSPWRTLSMLNPAGATALGGAAAAAAVQPAGEGYGDQDGFHPPLAAVAVFLGVIALDIWILLDKHHGHGHIDVDVNRPVSPD